MTAPMLHKPGRGEKWRTVELLGSHKSGNLVVREVGKFWPGVALAVGGSKIAFGKPHRHGPVLPPMTEAQAKLCRKLRPVVGRNAALIEALR